MSAITNRLANLNWIAAVFYPAAVVLMEVLWVYPWLVWMARWPEPDWYRTPLALVSLIIIMGGSFVIARHFPGRGAAALLLKLAAVLLLAFGVISIEYRVDYTLTAPFVAGAVAAVYAAWRGVRLGRSSLYFGDIARGFILGMVALVLLTIIWRVSLSEETFDTLASRVGAPAAGFFFFGLLALALGNLQDIQRQVTVVGKTSISGRRWLPIQLGVVGVITLLGIGLASIFSSEFVSFLSRIVSSVFGAISNALVYILYPFEWLARGMAYIIEWIISLINRGEPPEFEQPALFEPAELNQNPNTALPPDFITFLKWAAFVIVVTIVLWMLIRALNRYRAARAKTEVDEFQESLGSWRGLRRDIKLLLQAVWRRISGMRKRPAPAAAAWHYSADIQGQLDVREIYRRLLWEGADIGVRRRTYETPSEYARRLGAAAPETGDGLNELTGIYEARRYGEQGEPAGEERANGLWRIIHRVLRKPEARR